MPGGASGAHPQRRSESDPSPFSSKRFSRATGLTFDEACQTLRTNAGVESRDELTAIAERLPRRSRRALVSDEGLESRPALDGRTDAAVHLEQAADAARKAARALDEAKRQLPPQDRLILRMRFHDDFGVADIARALSLEQKPLL